MKPKILSFVDYYLPGHKAGGIITGVEALIQNLSDDFDFQIVTRDRDLGDTQNYYSQGAMPTEAVTYLSPEDRLEQIYKCLKHSNCDQIYLNSVFSFYFSILVLLLMRLGLVPKKPVTLASRGELSPSALSKKTLRKKLYLGFARKFKLFREVSWHAASTQEGEQIQNCFGTSAKILIGPDLLSRSHSLKDQTTYPPPSPPLRLVFLGRISPVKNLVWILETLKETHVPIQFHIYGPLENKTYWNNCEKLIDQLGSQVEVSYLGALAPYKVRSTLGEYHLFFLPSLGESFGYSIAEALMAGVPVLISDRTPWHNLKDHGAGWNLPLSEPKQFAQVIDEFFAEDAKKWTERRQSARRYAETLLFSEDRLAANRQLFSGPAGSSR